MTSGSSSDGFDAEEAPTCGTRAIQSSLERQRAALAKLSASVAHEIRTPLNAASLSLALMEEDFRQYGTGRQNMTASLAFVSKEIARASALLDEFLKLPVWRPMKRWVAPLNATLDRALAACSAEAASLSVRLSARIAVDFPAWMDHEHVEHAVTDLLRSALYGAGAGRQVRFSAREDAGLVTLLVERDGPPSRGDSNDLFSPVFEKTGSFPFALFGARQVFAAHGGDIRVERRGDSTVFEVQLPRLRGRSGSVPPTGA